MKPLTAFLALAVTALLAFLTPARADSQEVSVALLPASQTVAPGGEFDLEIAVTGEGLAFNGFTAVIGYDPDALTLIPQSPLSLQEGSYMTDACGNTFHRFRMGTDADTITDILLCAGVSLTGPGELYRLHFQASTTPQITTVRFLDGLKFYDAGLYVNPVSSSNAVIGIGMEPTAVGPPQAPGQLWLRIAPNPGFGDIVFTAGSHRAGPETLSVFDTQGRTVRRFSGGQYAPLTHVSWDGRDEAGVRLPPGVYFATLSVAGGSVTSRFTMLH